MRIVKDVKCITDLKSRSDHTPLQVTLKIAKCSRIRNYCRSGKTRLDIIPTSVIQKIKEEWNGKQKMKEIKSIGKVQKMFDVLEGIIKSDRILRKRWVEILGARKN